MMNWIRKKLRQWLGIKSNEADIERLDMLFSDLTNIGVDVHFKSPHMILIFSRLKGGQIRQIDVCFDNLRQLEELVKDLKERYRPHDIWMDLPYNFERRLF